MPGIMTFIRLSDAYGLTCGRIYIIKGVKGTKRERNANGKGTERERNAEREDAVLRKNTQKQVFFWYFAR